MKNYTYGLMLCLLLLVFGFATQVEAMPARGAEEVLKQPTGETFTAELNGNENLHWWLTTEGDVIRQGEDNYWYYAYIDGQSIKPTNAKYIIDEKPANAATLEQVSKIKPEPEVDPLQPNDSGDMVQTLSTTEESDVLVLLVGFKNEAVKYSDADWSNRFFGKSGSTLYNYYDEVSEGKLHFVAAEESSGTQNDGIVRVSLNENHPEPMLQEDISKGTQQIVSDALKAANGKVNFAKYDRNKNGSISADELHIVTIVAGYEASYGFANTKHSVWGHKSSIYKIDPPELDGVIVGDYISRGSYTMFGESHLLHMATVGIIAHEMGHDLGLPDLYDKDRSSLGVGIHSLMGSGSWATVKGEYSGEFPTHLDPWSKIALGFVKPKVVTENGDYDVANFSQDDFSVLKIDLTKNGEYFLLENRQYKGFDRGLEEKTNSSGIAIWHIIENKMYGNEVNVDENHKGMDLEEANEGKLGFSQLDEKKYSDYSHYYTGDGFNQFNSNTTPSSNNDTGEDSGVAIKVLSNSKDHMKVSVTVPTDDHTPPVWPENTEIKVVGKTDTSVTLDWSDAKDRYGISGYSIFKNGVNISDFDLLESKTKIGGLTEDTEYTFKIEASDFFQNKSMDGPSITVKTNVDNTERIAGANRFDTSALISKKAFTEAETVVIARGREFPDALAGAPLARKLHAPILLVETDELPEETMEEIKRLKAKKAIILGGVNAIDSSTEEAIQSLGLRTERISGENRYETAAKIAERLGGNPEQAIIAYGRNFPDALSIAPYASEKGYPILLVESDEIPLATTKALESIQDTIVVGGEQVISKDVYQDLPSPHRIFGENRFATAAAVKEEFYPNAETVYLATGFDFADALSGTMLASKDGAPLLLVKKDDITYETANEVYGNVTSAKLLGGPEAISEAVLQQFYRLKEYWG